MASEPVRTPTTPLPRVSKADAAIEVSATFSFTFRIRAPLVATGSGADKARQCGTAFVSVVRRHIIRHGSANEWHLRNASAPLFGGTDDGSTRLLRHTSTLVCTWCTERCRALQIGAIKPRL